MLYVIILLLGIDYGNVNCTLKYVYDGDTFKVDIPEWPDIIGKSISIRIYGINAPELKNKDESIKEQARQAKMRLVTLLKGGKIELREIRRDKYFRILAKVYVNNIDIGKTLIEEGLAKEYYGKSN